MKTFTLIITTGLLTLSGCGPLTTPVNRDGESPRTSQLHAPASDIWSALANEIDADVIQTPNELAQYVKALNETGDLSNDDLRTFDDEFPNAPADQRQLDKSDVKALRGMK